MFIPMIFVNFQDILETISIVIDKNIYPLDVHVCKSIVHMCLQTKQICLLTLCIPVDFPIQIDTLSIK